VDYKKVIRYSKKVTFSYSMSIVGEGEMSVRGDTKRGNSNKGEFDTTNSLFKVPELWVLGNDWVG
jgi:hypothetical protein